MAMTTREIIEEVKDRQNRERIVADKERFNVYNGKLKDTIRRAIAREFEKPETVAGLIGRIVPINIVQKIVNKLALVYMQPPSRASLMGNPSDDELIDLYADSLRMNANGKMANRFVELHKHTAWMPYVDRDGIPRLRTLPSQSYTPISNDPIQPERPTAFVTHMVEAMKPEDQRFSVWTDEEFLIVDGLGDVSAQSMKELNNPDGVNPFGAIPFQYISESDDGMLIPISDDDLISMQVTICLLLTDLAFASKYQLWSIFVMKNAQGSGKIELNPNSLISLPPGADLDVVKPDVDIDKAIRFIEMSIATLLTTRNMKVGDISGSAKTDGVSGVAKIIDQSETTDDRRDQQEMFINAEESLWKLFAHRMLPYWVKTGKINKDYVGKFSDDFELKIQFMDPKPTISLKDTVEVERMKLDAGFTTKKLALQKVHPDMDNEEIENLTEEIAKEKKESIQSLMSMSQESDEGEDES